MTRLIGGIAVAASAALFPLSQQGHLAHASSGTRVTQTVALHRQNCSASTTGPQAGTVRFSPDDQGGNPGGMEINSSVTAGLARTDYGVYLLTGPCTPLLRIGTLHTDDSGRGDLDVHVAGSSLLPGPGHRIQLVAPADE